MRNDGKPAEDAFIKRISAIPKTVVERLYDASDLRGLNGGKHINDFKKPSDFIVTCLGTVHYAEVKSVQSATSFPFSNLEDGQRSAALRQAASDGQYIFYIYSFGLSEWFLMDCRVFAKAVADGRKSIKFSELMPWKDPA